MINILVAEDDIRILRLITDFLKKEIYNVYTAKDGQEALETFNKEEISLVVLDIMMPIYDGWHVCKQIRKKSNVPILILTAKDSDLDELFGFDIGADEYISKPFNPNLLIARIKNLLKRLEVPNDEIEVLGNSINTLSSKIKNTMDTLKTKNEELEILISNKIKQEKLKREFVSSVSHELKTPITVINGYAEGLRSNILDSEEDKQDYIDVICEESEKMGMIY